MADWGFFTVDRGLWGHPFFKPEPFTERESWVWLISAAAFKPIRVAYQGVIVLLERAEFCFSLRFMAEKWRWEKTRVERYLKRLQNHDMIRDTSRDGAKVYLIANYNKFNSVTIQDRDSNRDTTATPPRQDRDKEEKLNNSTIETPSLRSGVTNRKSKIPENCPSQADRQAAVKFWTERGRPDLCATVDLEADQFRDRCAGDGVTALDWSAKWRTWVRNAMKFNKKASTHGTGRPESSHEQTERIAREFIADFEASDPTRNSNRDCAAGDSLPRLLAHDPGIAPGMDEDAMPRPRS